MQMPHVIGAGVYRRAEKYRQTIPAKWLSFYVKGLIKSTSYYPDGKLCRIFSDDNCPRILVSTPGMVTDFMFGPDRENWVIMLDFPALDYNPERHEIYLQDDDRHYVLPDSIPVAEPDFQATRDLFAAITTSFRSALPQDLLKADLLCSYLFSTFFTGRLTDDPVDTLKRLIDEDSRWENSISELCRRVGYNRDYLRREFQTRYQISPGEYRTRRRLQEIMHLITYTHLSLKEIAYQTGMKHVTHLNALLKQHYGKTPTELCRKYRRYDVDFIKSSPVDGPLP